MYVYIACINIIYKYCIYMNIYELCRYKYNIHTLIGWGSSTDTHIRN